MQNKLLLSLVVAMCLILSCCGKIITSVAQVMIMKEALNNDTIMNQVTSIKDQLVSLPPDDVQNYCVKLDSQNICSSISNQLGKLGISEINSQDIITFYNKLLINNIDVNSSVKEIIDKLNLKN
jgi:hypothetical protein